jgi:xylan 1,4-beta-xylosidase
MTLIHNPILRGFNPDPSILRVGQDYYIATSTFEWFPGIRLYHSTDLVNWDLIGYPLDSTDKINMLGEDNSCGVWAPCLSCSEGIFYLVYTDVKSFRGSFKDTHNYLITAENICGPWSEPVYLNSSGFDPSLFHDENGKKYFLNMQMDYRSYHSKFGGIVLQEYDCRKKKLVGEQKLIFKGSHIGYTEGPHLYQRNGYYYLVTAEGMTGFEHAVTVARSRTLFGPYETAPNTPLLTAHHLPECGLQKAGHASIVSTPDGEWYLAHLCSRPVGEDRRCILGRETGLQRVIWRNDWLYMENGTIGPDMVLQVGMGEKEIPVNPVKLFEDFNGRTWDKNLQTLRLPLGERGDLKAREGWLRLYGAESLNSKYRQSLLAHRQQEFYVEAVTKIDFEPQSFQQMAGLTYFYNTDCYYYLYLSRDEYEGKTLSILQCDLGKGSHPIGMGVSIPEHRELFLRLKTSKEKAQFSYSLDGETYLNIGDAMDATKLSDDYFQKTGHVMFTGAFIGICCQDLSGVGGYADFDFFSYMEE